MFLPKACLILLFMSPASVTAGIQSGWWMTRFQALWLPNLKYADDSMGFIQLDVSLNEAK